MSRRSHVRLLRCALALGLAIAASSLSAPAIAAAQRGGSTIASAPELPLDTAVVSGANGDEFWRVTMAVGDKLTIDFQPLNNGHVHLYLYKPSETDFTIGKAKSVKEAHGDGPSQFGWTVAEQGAWILKVSCTRGYQLTARVDRGSVTQVVPRYTIATALQLPLNTAFVAGNNGDEFWRVSMSAGDRLAIDFQPLNDGHVHLYLYKPSETDFTIGNAHTVAEGHGDDPSQFGWTVAEQGAWILKVSCTRGYQLTAKVVRGNATQVTPGHTVGTAIRLPLNTTFVSGNNGDEFWRVAMAARDRLTINYRSLNGGHVHLYIYSPRETDFTIGSARSAAESHTDTTAKFIWSAPTKGSWLLKVSCTRGYQLRASVKHGR